MFETATSKAFIAALHWSIYFKPHTITLAFLGHQYELFHIS